jgi:hypothetical protein
VEDHGKISSITFGQRSPYNPPTMIAEPTIKDEQQKFLQNKQLNDCVATRFDIHVAVAL